MLDDNIIRWINASINKHFDTNRSGIKLYVEGEKPPSNELKWAELRLTGPRYLQQSKACHYYEVDINIMVAVKINDQDTYDIHRIVGIFAKAMNMVIPIKKYGNDGTEIACLILKNELIDVIPWGILDATTKVFYTSLDAFYKMEI